MRVPPFFVPLRGVGVVNSRGVHPHLFELHWRIQDAVLYEGLEAIPNGAKNIMALPDNISQRVLI